MKDKEYVNPKDLIGCKKPPMWVIPDTALLHTGMAFRNGANKYGPYNWREQRVCASIYIDAIMRHLILWKAGEEYADDSGVHHLGHLIASAAILIDAQAHNKLMDDRPRSQATLDLMKQLEKQIAKESVSTGEVITSNTPLSASCQPGCLTQNVYVDMGFGKIGQEQNGVVVFVGFGELNKDGTMKAGTFRYSSIEKV